MSTDNNDITNGTQQPTDTDKQQVSSLRDRVIEQLHTVYDPEIRWTSTSWG